MVAKYARWFFLEDRLSRKIPRTKRIKLSRLNGGFTLSLPGGYSFFVIIGGVVLHSVRLLTDRQYRSYDRVNDYR